MALKLGELVAYLRADDTALARGLKSAQDKMRQAGPVVGAALAAGIGAGLLGGLDLNSARAKLTAQVGDPALAEKLGRVAGNVYGRGFGESAAEAMEAARAVSSLVPDGDAAKIEDLTIKAQAYAKAWDTDVAAAAQYASTLIGSGLARDADHAMDLITAASARVPVALREDVLEAGDEYGQFFRTLGFNGEQAFGLLVEASAKGQYGIDKAGDAIKEFTILSTDMSASSVAAYKAIGLDAGKMSNQILKGGKSAQGAFQQIVSGLLSIKDPTKQANAAIGLFGPPLEDLNVKDIPEFLRNMQSAGAGLGDVAGASKAAGDSLEQDAGQRLEAFKRRVQQALIEKVGQAIPTLEKVGTWAQENTGTLLTIGGVIAGLAVTVWAVQGAIAAWNAVQLIWTGITKAAAAAQWLLNIAMSANPIGLIILAIVALVAGIVLLWRNSEAFRKFWIAVWEGIKTAAIAVWDFIIAAAKKWWEVFSGVWTAIGRWFVGLFKRWWNLFTGFWGAVFDGIGKAGSWVKDKVSDLLGWFTSLPGRLRRGLANIRDIVSAPFRAAFNWIARGWNRTVGRLSWTVPSWVPHFGGNSISAPHLPMLAKGGTALAPGWSIVGERGPELAYLNRGATVQPLSRGGGGAGGGISMLRVILQWPDGRVIKDQLVDAASLRGQTVGRYLSVSTS